MEERVVKISAIFMVLFTAAACALLFFLPDFHAAEIAKQENPAVEETPEPVQMDMVDLGTGDQPVEEEITFPQQLRIMLPEGVTEADVTITNRYLTQTVDIMFPGVDENYIYRYPIIGRSNNIDNLTVESENGQGVIEITLEKVFEVEPTFEEGFLYLDFLSPHDVYDKVVVVDAGHGGGMPGAIIKGYNEKDIDLAIVLELKQIFEEHPEDNIGVYYTRLDDTNPSFEERVGLANKTEADLFISVHNNSTVSGKTSSINGTTVMYDELKEDTGHGTKEFAQICVDEVSGILGTRNRGITGGNENYIIRNSEVPVALIEVGFMTNPTELANLVSQDYQRKTAQGIYNAVKRAFEEGF